MGPAAETVSEKKKEESCEENLSDIETNYFDSLCPTGDSKEYVDRLKVDIGKLRREYSVPKNKLAEEHLTKRTLYKNTSQKTPSHKKRNANREIETRTRLGSQGDVWFGCSRFQDSGERIGGGRRYSEERGGRGSGEGRRSLSSQG